MIKQTITATLVALSLGTAIAATTTSAFADCEYGGYGCPSYSHNDEPHYGYHRRGYSNGNQYGYHRRGYDDDSQYGYHRRGYDGGYNSGY